MRLALAQLNTTVGDLEGNKSRILEVLQEAEVDDADMVCFPELSLCGYPPEDLLLKRDFIAACSRALNELAREVGDVVAVVGTLDLREDLFNAAAVLHRGEVAAVYHKRFLPNYGVFDEIRYFAAGTEGLVVILDGVRVGITICEDVWHPEGPLEEEVTFGGAEVVINISSSPYYRQVVGLKLRDDGLHRQAFLHLVPVQGEPAVIDVQAAGGETRKRRGVLDDQDQAPAPYLRRHLAIEVQVLGGAREVGIEDGVVQADGYAPDPHGLQAVQGLHDARQRLLVQQGSTSITVGGDQLDAECGIVSLAVPEA